MLGSLLDNTIGIFNPAAALRRKMQRDMLATYAGADKGRRNKDWRASNRSADAAIIPDAETMNARARQMIRDSWVARSLQLSKSRNIVGRGITPVPVASDAAGGELAELNKTAERLFWEWASCAESCDVEGRQTFWQKQSLCVDEKFAVGEHFIVWSYVPGGKHVGLKLQSYEPEQLDLTKQREGDNEVRGGIEVDAHGKAVAYHFYLRNPNDYLSRKSLQSTRIGRERVFHYYRPGRTLQTRGVTELAPVMQRIRDFNRRDEAELMASIMEACVGMAITRNVGSGSGVAPGLPRADGDTGETAGGLRTFDLAPGMIAELNPGEDVKFLTPTRPGSGYEPFARMNLRGIAAGCDTSYDQVARDFDQGSYSSKRQAMLEDWRGWRPEQDLLIDTVISPVYELFYRFAVLEGRLPGLTAQAFAAEPHRYVDAEYVPDGHDWIDPKNEVIAIEKALELRLTTRKEEYAKRGGRFLRGFDQIKAEREAAAARGITLPEDVKNAPASTPAAPTSPPVPGGASPATPPTPAGNADAGVTTDLTLNGAQITAAIDVMTRIRSGDIDDFSASELLVAVGIERATADRMVVEAKKLPPPAQPPAAPPAPIQ